MSDNVDDLLFAMGRPMLLTNGEVRILLERAGTALRGTRDDRDRLQVIVEAARNYRNAVDIAERPPDVTMEQYVITGDRLLKELGQALDALDAEGET